MPEVAELKTRRSSQNKKWEHKAHRPPPMTLSKFIENLGYI